MFQKEGRIIKKFGIPSILIFSFLLVLSACTAEINIHDNPDSDVKIDQPANQDDDTDENIVTDENKATDETNKDNTNTEENQNADDESKQDNTDKETLPLENDAFKIISPTPEQAVKDSILLKGKARVFEATFQYQLEDGHDVLAEGVITANGGAPAWGDFEKEISFSGATSPNAVLYLFVNSPKDGSRQNELVIPLKLEKWE